MFFIITYGSFFLLLIGLIGLYKLSIWIIYIVWNYEICLNYMVINEVVCVYEKLVYYNMCCIGHDAVHNSLYWFSVDFDNQVSETLAISKN